MRNSGKPEFRCNPSTSQNDHASGWTRGSSPGVTAPGVLLRRHGLLRRATNAHPFERAEDPARHEDDAQDEKYAVDRVGRADEIGGEADARAFVQRDRQE